MLYDISPPTELFVASDEFHLYPDPILGTPIVKRRSGDLKRVGTFEFHLLSPCLYRSMKFGVIKIR